ncbi:hypothetical protein PSI19_21450 [Xenorhabdus khoisanae]|uniref:hypothetical protein n=1 Tax=Xenorhabdus khoisanae TaxID=880157 RepID=UPI00235998F1|nr:hypothetical protein [Xenorhabdus khoisanae]MDC9616360.1 hypothetical protein [Xenorhabdus khoisanae]
MSFNCNGTDWSAQNTASQASTAARFAQISADRASTLADYASREIANMVRVVEALESKIKN